MRWNLDALYRSFESESYQNDIKELDTKIAELNTWTETELLEFPNEKENPGETGDIIRIYLDLYINIRKLLFGLSSYAELTFSVDASNNTAKKYTERMEQRLPEITKGTVLFSRWIAKIKNLDAVIANSGLLKEHSFYLQEIINNSKYLLSDKEEILAAKLKNSGSNAWSQLWNVLTSTVKVDIEIDGEKKELPLPVVRNMANEADAVIRKKAFEAELAVYEKFGESAAAALNGVKGEVITMTELRGYESPLDMTIKNSRMDKETLDAMFTAIKEYLPVFRKYFNKRLNFWGTVRGCRFTTFLLLWKKVLKRKV